MMGSFYHFHVNAEALLASMFEVSNTVILSEPVSNLSASGGLIGFLAKMAANAGKGHEEFRYNRRSFMAMLEDYRMVIGYAVTYTCDQGKDLIVKLEKNETC
jgi:hypothetical protein